MKPILISTHACMDTFGDKGGRYTLSIYQCPITRAIIEKRETEVDIEFTGTLVEREHIISSRRLMRLYEPPRLDDVRHVMKMTSSTTSIAHELAPRRTPSHRAYRWWSVQR